MTIHLLICKPSLYGEIVLFQLVFSVRYMCTCIQCKYLYLDDIHWQVQIYSLLSRLPLILHCRCWIRFCNGGSSHRVDAFMLLCSSTIVLMFKLTGYMHLDHCNTLFCENNWGKLRPKLAQLPLAICMCMCVYMYGYTPRARLLSVLATECRRHEVAKSLGNQARGVQPACTMATQNSKIRLISSIALKSRLITYLST